MVKLIIKGIPQTTNRLYKSRCIGKFASVYMTTKGKDTKEDYMWQAKSQWKKDPSEEPFEVEIDLYFNNKRKHDVDNYNKILLDALSNIVWVDDYQIQSLLVRKHYDKENPRIELSAVELTDKPIIN